MIMGFVLAVGLAVAPQVQATPPPLPPSQADLSAIAFHAARLTLLEQRKQESDAALVRARIRLQLGDKHPDVMALVRQLDAAERALAAEFFEWNEAVLQRLTDKKAVLERDMNQMVVGRRLGTRHPEVQALVARIAAGPSDLYPLFRLARLYEGAGRDADAERTLSDALVWLRARGK
ncbi:MAG: hypothetical protein HQ485_01190 [Acidobacteria bacterium]|nr:hypothetical protein [Acidobacteriota bacterium]